MLAGVGGGLAVGVDGQLGGGELQLLEEGAEGHGGGAHHLAVEGRGHVQALEAQAGGLELLLGLGDVGGLAREHHLGGAVVVGHHDAHRGLLEEGLHGLDVGAHGGHGAVGLGGLGHELAPTAGDADGVLLAEHAGGVQGDDLTEAVATHGVGLQAQLAQHGQQGQGGHADGGLGPLGGGEALAVPGALCLVEGGTGEDHLVQGQLRVHGHGGGPIPGADGRLVAHDHVLAHAQVLAALAGEEEGHLAGLAAAHAAPVDALGAALGRVTEEGLGLVELAGEVGVALHHQRQPAGLGGVEGQGPVAGQPAEPGLGLGGAGAHAGACQGELLADAGEIGGGERHELHGLGAEAVGALGAPVLLDGHVEVGAAEAEAAHAGAPGVIGPTHPGTGLRREVEGALLDVEVGVGALDLDGGRQDLVVQGHDGLEEARGARRGLGVADLGLHAAQGAPLRVSLGRGGLGEHGAQALELGGVAGLGAGAVGLEELDGARRVAGALVGAAQGLGLARGQGGVDGLCAAVAAGAHAVDDAVDAVAVALGVLEAAQGHHGEALAEDGAVGLVAEGPAVTRRRERRGLAEAHVHEDVVHGVDAAADDDVAVPEPELVGGHLHGGEGAGAGRVGDAVGPAEVEAVGDAAGDNVAQEAREVGLAPVGVVAGDALLDLLDLALGQAVLAQGLDPDGPLEAAGHAAHELLAGGDAEDDAHALAIEVIELPLPGVLEDLLGHHEGQDLRGVGGGHDAGRHAPGHGVELHVLQEGAPLGVGLVRHAGIGIVVVLDEPVGLGDLGHEVAAGEDVAPEARLLHAAGEERAHPDDGEGALLAEGGLAGLGAGLEIVLGVVAHGCSRACGACGACVPFRRGDGACRRRPRRARPRRRSGAAGRG